MTRHKRSTTETATEVHIYIREGRVIVVANNRPLARSFDEGDSLAWARQVLMDLGADDAVRVLLGVDEGGRD